MIRYWLLRICSLIWLRLPLKVGYQLASLVGDLTYLAWPKGRANARENMAHVLGVGADWRLIDKAARQSLRNYCKYLVDFMRFPSLRPEDIDGKVVFDGWENLDRAFQSGKGIILIGLHLGNWDLAAAAIAKRQYPLNVIAESLTPAKLNDIVQRARAKVGMKIIPMEHAARGVVRALRRNEMLALLIDNPAAESTVAVEFFNAVTWVPAGAATLALKTGAKVIPGGLVRQHDNTFLGFIDEHIPFQPSGDFQEDVRMLTQRIMASLEKAVREYPDQWYMFRRMWASEQPDSVG